MPQCSKGHPLREISRRIVKEAVEEVVYNKERIKHFNREGSEYWTEIEVPDVIEKQSEFECIEYFCDLCQENKVEKLERNTAPVSQ